MAASVDLDGHDWGNLACASKEASRAVDWEAIKAAYRPAVQAAAGVGTLTGGAGTLTGGAGTLTGGKLTASDCRKRYGLDVRDVVPGSRLDVRTATGIALLKHGGPRGLQAVVDATPRGRRLLRIGEIGITPSDARSLSVRVAVDMYGRAGKLGLERLRKIVTEQRQKLRALDDAGPDVRRVGLRLLDRVSALRNDAEWDWCPDHFTPEQVVARARAILDGPARLRRVTSAYAPLSASAVSRLSLAVFEDDEACRRSVLEEIARARRRDELDRALSSAGLHPTDVRDHARFDFVERGWPESVQDLVTAATEDAWLRDNAGFVDDETSASASVHPVFRECCKYVVFRRWLGVRSIERGDDDDDLDFPATLRRFDHAT